MNRKATYLFATAIIFGSLTSPANAQSVLNNVPAAILACADEMDVMRRLSCYDREVAAASLAPQSATTAPPTLAESAPVVPDAPVPTEVAPIAAPISTTAVSASVIAAAPETGNDAKEQPPESTNSEADFGFTIPVGDITAVVVEIRERPYGELIIRLDNDQVWEQKHVDRRFRLQVGETITIAKGAISGYRLSAPGNQSIQVTRRN